MARVALLPDDLVDQIAAGEVVERPASVVKELVENALDAGARAISVEIEGGGLGLVRVVDDGRGMDGEDAALAVRRHATSKLRSASDLERIATLGFRGEALPSIASVSRFSLRTRLRDALEGVEVRVEGGGAARVEPIGAPAGTTVTVRDLFYNVPARRKFLRAESTEAAHVADVCVRAALGDPGLRLVLSRDGRRWRELLPLGDRVQRARALFPDEQLASVAAERDGVRVEAMLSPPERARSGATGLYLYVNGRPVRDRALARAVSFAFGSVLGAGRYPVGAVWIEVALDRVDVNVHPQKAEVRFSDARTVLDAVTRGLASSLGRAPFASVVGRGTSASVATDTKAPEYGASYAAAPTVPYGLGTPSHAAAEPADPWGLAGPSGVGVRDAPDEARGAASDGATLLGPGGLRLLGQVQRTYLVCEGPRGLVVLDQHAADERVRFAKLRAAYEARAVPVQRLLLPERVALSASDLARLAEHEAELATLGLDVAAIGEGVVAVRAVPAILGRVSPSRLVHDVLAELGKTGDCAFGGHLDRVMATLACHGALRAGDALAPRECEELVRALVEVQDFRGHCPHGRPVLVELGWDELARRVGR